MRYVSAYDMIEGNGRTWRENNLAIQHRIPLGTLVHLCYDKWDSGSGCSMKAEARMRVVTHDRDCDGTPLYGLAFCTLDDYQFWGQYIDPVQRSATGYIHGFAEKYLTVVEETPDILNGNDALSWPE